MAYTYTYTYFAAAKYSVLIIFFVVYDFILACEQSLKVRRTAVEHRTRICDLIIRLAHAAEGEGASSGIG